LPAPRRHESPKQDAMTSPTSTVQYTVLDHLSVTVPGALLAN
jgi:hypothetical protein